MLVEAAILPRSFLFFSTLSRAAGGPGVRPRSVRSGPARHDGLVWRAAPLLIGEAFAITGEKTLGTWTQGTP